MLKGMRRSILLLVFASFAVLAGACSGDDEGSEDRTAGTSCETGEGGSHYFVFAAPDWEFREAVDYPDDLGPLEAVEPTLDWFAEHERLTPSADGQTVEGVSLRLSGHDASLDEQRSELVGADLRDQQIGGTRALAGIGPDGAPTVVTMAVADDYTLMLLSYGLDLEELIQIAADVQPACEQEWIEAGGEILECMPTDPDCAPGP